MFTVLAEQFPDLIPFVTWLYNNPSELAFGESTIMSEEGAQQGDPLGPLLFCLGIPPVLSELRRPFPAVASYFYIDNGILICEDEGILSI